MKDSYHHKNLKSELIQTGLEWIRQHGVEGLSLRKLSSICQVSEAAPYSHFRNKNELLQAMQDYAASQLLEVLQSAADAAATPDEPDIILNMGKAYLSFFTEHPSYFSFLFTHSNIKIDLSSNTSEECFQPFRYFQEKAYEVYRREGVPDERIKYGIIAMWAKVQGLTQIICSISLG